MQPDGDHAQRAQCAEQRWESIRRERIEAHPEAPMAGRYRPLGGDVGSKHRRAKPDAPY
jgi:hypothetical protein